MPITINLTRGDLDLLRKIKEISGQNVKRCMQCGMCSGTCPMFDTGELQAPPRRIMHLLQAGLVDRVEKLNTCWSCASCNACMVKCPRSIDIPRVMEALRQLTLRQNVDHIAPAKAMEVTHAGGPPMLYVSAFRKLTA